MNKNELHERYICLAFQYESAIDALLTKGLVDMEAASVAKERFYDTLNEERLLATQKIKDYRTTATCICPSNFCRGAKPHRKR